MTSWLPSVSAALTRAFTSTTAQPTTPLGPPVTNDTAAQEWAERPKFLKFTDANGKPGYPHMDTLARYRDMRPKYVAQLGQDVNPIEWLGDNTSVHTIFGIPERWGNAVKAKLLEVEAKLQADGIVHGVTNAFGFNPRYIEGTKILSAHAFGKGVDLNPADNPLITSKDIFAVIEAAAGSDLLEITTATAAEAYDAAKKIDGDFKTNFTQAWVDGVTDPDLAAKIEANRATLDRYAQGGFLNLKKELVVAMVDKEYKWGGVYGDRKDFHHFELE